VPKFKKVRIFLHVTNDNSMRKVPSYGVDAVLRPFASSLHHRGHHTAYDTTYDDIQQKVMTSPIRGGASITLNTKRVSLTPLTNVAPRWMFKMAITSMIPHATHTSQTASHGRMQAKHIQNHTELSKSTHGYNHGHEFSS
jgi:hypothetical protein